MKITEGQEINIETLHSGNNSLKGRIDKIYPTGIEKNGIVNFPFEASINTYPGKLWGGMNATAVIITNSVNNALCLEEKYLVYEKDSCYAWIRDEDTQYRKTNLITGLSDGLKTQIVKGLNKNDRVKLPEDD